jgi:hypothetical protein
MWWTISLIFSARSGSVHGCAPRKKGKKNGFAATCPQFLVSRFDEIAEIWVAVVARRKVT